jgi:hypothetical protein
MFSVKLLAMLTHRQNICSKFPRFDTIYKHNCAFSFKYKYCYFTFSSSAGFLFDHTLEVVVSEA